MFRIVDMLGICPTNYKAGTLILNKYRSFDLVVLISSWLIAIVNLGLMLWIFKPSIAYFMILVMSIPALGMFLVQPVPNYHNTLVYLKLIIKFQFKNKYYTNLIVKNKRRTTRKNKKKEDDLTEKEKENDEII